jgi:cation transport ATPase
VLADDRLRAEEFVSLAASLDQVSPHVLASAIVTHARGRGYELAMPEDVHEVTGYGLEGRVNGRNVRLGKARWIVGDASPAWVRQVRRRAAFDGSLTWRRRSARRAFLLEDPIVPTHSNDRHLRNVGIERR